VQGILRVIFCNGAGFGVQVDGSFRAYPKIHRDHGVPGTWALAGCTVAPGFDFADFTMARRAELRENFPQHRPLIEQLTR
jgi:hypothetical protein